MKTLEELKKDSLQLDSISRALKEAIRTKDDTDTVQVSIVLRVATWKQLLIIMAYNQSEGRRNFYTLASTIWQLIERSYKGIVKKIGHEGGGNPSPQPKTPYKKPETLEEALAIIDQLIEGKPEPQGGGGEDIFPDYNSV